MSKHKQYVLIIALIFAGQVFLATLFMNALEGSDAQKKQITLLEKKNKSLKSEVDQLSVVKGRDIASLPTAEEIKAELEDLQFDLSDVYFSRLEKHKKEKNKEAALGLIEKIQATTKDSENKARAEFEKISLICNQNLEIDCMKQIDSIITQFPHSNWTAKSLLLLSHFYFKQNRITESKSLIQVIQTEFKAYNDLNRDIQKLASQNL